jgi:methionyl-tRNA formyltransferase
MVNVAAAPNKTHVLLVSDNVELTKFFKEKVEATLSPMSAAIDYRFSSVNKNSAELQSLGSVSIDLKNTAAVNTVIQEYDVVISAHCKQIFPKELVNNVLCVNIHPGFNPYNRGWYPQVFGILNGKPIGATIHVMDTDIDHGDIIAQVRIDLEPSDTSLTTYRKIMDAEKILIERNIERIVSGTFTSVAPSQEGNYNSVADFRALCNLNLDDVGTLRAHLNLLRALTHGEFNNAYFTDPNGRRYFVRILIEGEAASPNAGD